MKLNKMYRKIFYCIVLLFLLTASSCEKEICMICYRVDAGGIVQGTETKMCGEEGIQHLRDRGYLCQ
jgi:hypothetical protein